MNVTTCNNLPTMCFSFELNLINMQNYGILLVITPNIKSGCINDQFIYS